VYDDALRLTWRTVGTGGSWDILASNDDIVAVEIPHGVVADHIVNLHNRSLNLKTAAKKE
jgi:hypothetical protein